MSPQAGLQTAAGCWRHVPLLLLLLLLMGWGNWARCSCAGSGLQVASLACAMRQLALLLQRSSRGKLGRRRHHAFCAGTRSPVARARLPAVCRGLLLPLLLLGCGPSCTTRPPACCCGGGQRSVAD